MTERDKNEKLYVDRKYKMREKNVRKTKQKKRKEGKVRKN